MDPRHGPLFQPLKIGPVTAPNRLAAVPYALGFSDLMPMGAMGFRATRAEGGWGIVAMQLTEIDPTSDLSGLRYEKLWDEHDIRRHAASVDRIKAHGALASIELAHTGIRSRGISNGFPPLGPSGLPTLKPEMPFMARAMDLADIRALRANHRAAVRRAREAGYDIATVYAAHDASILWHFLSPFYNRRSDAYGGSFENRLRLLREVLEEARDEARGAMAIALRFAVHELSGPRAILHDGEGRAVVEALAELPDLWDVNVSGWSRDSATSRYEEEGHQEPFVAFVKQVTTRPVLGVGRFTSPDAMVSQIRRGVLDLIGAARPSIADPFLPAKIREGRAGDIRECIGCNVCVAADQMNVELRCTQNPTVSEEWRRGWHPERVPRAPRAESVLIVGGGPAGLEAALVLARAGHQVSVAEARPDFGGRVMREARIRGLAAWGRVADHRLYQLRQMANVSLYASSPMEEGELADFAADHLLLATGAAWLGDGRGRSRLTPIPGFAGKALTPDQVLDGAALPQDLVIYDDDHAYLANALAADLAARGHRVQIVSPQPSLAPFMAQSLEQPRVIAELLKAGVAIHPNTTAACWGEGGLEVMRSDTGAALDPIPGSALIHVGLRQPDQALAQALNRLGIAHRVIGDAECPGLIQAAVYSGHRHARGLLGQDHATFLRDRAVLF